jgi:hypothetical protein
VKYLGPALIVTIVVVSLSAFGVFLVEVVRFAYFKTQPPNYERPIGREMTEEEKQLWIQALSEKWRRARDAESKAIIALYVAFGLPLSCLLAAVMRKLCRQRNPGREKLDTTA